MVGMGYSGNVSRPHHVRLGPQKTPSSALFLGDAHHRHAVIVHRLRRLGLQGASALIATTTALSSSSTNPALNAPVAFTAVVRPSTSSGSATGTVSFSSGSTMLGTTPLSASSAVFVSSNLAIGQQAITATYSGDANYAKSQSATASIDVVFSTTIVVTGTGKAGNTNSSNLLLTIQ
jgi:hypothetical protein